MKITYYILITLSFLGLIVLGCIESPKDEKMSIKVLAHGSPIHGANGIIFDNKDMLYIASIFGREIIVMDPETGKILERLGSEYGIEGPDDLIFGPDGSLYWTAIITGEVTTVAENLDLGLETIPGMMPTYIFNGVAVGPSGTIYVTGDVANVLYCIEPKS